MCECKIVFKGDYHAQAYAKAHGQCKTRTKMYYRWLGMKQRCFYKDTYCKKAGIGVWKDWSDSFAKFYDHFGEPPFEGASLDRIDPTLHYCPHNVRWADKKMQARNRTNKKTGKYKMGVRKNEGRTKFHAVIYMNNKPIILGYYETENAAHEAYVQAKKSMHGVDLYGS